MMLATVAFATPAAAYAVFTFGPSNPITFAESQRILAEVRIPHHTMIDRWFAWPDAVQLVWIAVGLLLLRRSPLCLVLSIAAALGTVLTLVQYSSQSDSFALLFPWRISAVLVPAATAVIAASLAARLPSSNAVAIGAGAVMVALAAGGIWIMAAGVGYRMNEDETALPRFCSEGGQAERCLSPAGEFPGSGPWSRHRFYHVHAATAAQTGLKPDPGRFAAFPPGHRHSDLCRFQVGALSRWRGARMAAAHEAMRGMVRGGLVSIWERSGVCERPASRTSSRPAAKPIKADGLIEVHADPAYIVYEVR